jgi:hypothetical protein
MRVGAIIPTVNDDAALQRLLMRLAEIRPPLDEIVVVDGAASAGCALACRAAGVSWVPARAGRAGLLALGAAHCRADVLWFLPADCEPHVDAVAAIRRSIAEGAVGGYFRFRFAGARTPAKRLLEECIAWRCRHGAARDDQGIFVTRSAYTASPGFTLQPVFEEIALVRALKRTRRFAALDLPIAVSPRRWEREGYLRRTLANRALALFFAFGVAPARLARWDAARPRPTPPGRGARAGRSDSDGHEAHKV